MTSYMESGTTGSMSCRYVLVEGWDRVGKSTLARKLARWLGKPYVHLGPPKKDTATELTEVLEAYPDGVVLDRAWWSARVYAPLARGREELSLTALRWLELAAADGVLVHVDCDPLTLAERQVGLDPYGRLLPPNQALQAFRDELARSRLPPRRRRVYWTGPYRGAKARPEELIGWLRSLETWTGDALGNPVCAKAAVVGENHPRGLAPFALSRSGTYLLNVLERLAWSTDDLFITNADSPTLVEDLRYLHQAGRPIVALGHEAHARLSQLAYRPAFHYHPQFWARFKTGHEVDYLRALAKILGFSLAS